MKYIFRCLTAHDVGENRPPDTVIRELAPDATNLQPESVFDAWTFESAAIANPPAFIDEEKCASLPVVGAGEVEPIPAAPAPPWPSPFPAEQGETAVIDGKGTK